MKTRSRTQNNKPIQCFLECNARSDVTNKSMYWSLLLYPVGFSFVCELCRLCEILAYS